MQNLFQNTIHYLTIKLSLEFKLSCVYQVSGLKFTFDPDLPSGNRIISGSVYVAGEVLQPNKVIIKYSYNFICLNALVCSCINYVQRIIWLKEKMDMICLKCRKDW